jgi:hypothetical protein
MASVFRPATAVSAVTGIVPFATRIEPNPVSGDPEVGLMAQVWDPLWMLGRQWQFGEFAGEDTGTPLAVSVSAEFDPITAWHPGPLPEEEDSRDWQAWRAGDLLEPHVEAEASDPPPDGSGHTRFAVVAAWALQDVLAELGEATAVARIVQRFPVTTVGDDASDWAQTQRMLVGRTFDAQAFASAIAGSHPAWLTAALRREGREAARAAIDEWRAWFAEESGAEATLSSWVDRRLEYGFSVATTAQVLSAPEYGGGTVGWSSFDLLPRENAPDAAGQVPEPIARNVLASRLEFPGSPVSRFWEFEDAAVSLGAVYADPDELARVLVVEAAIVTGDDWLVLPVDTPPGGVLRVHGVRWVDTFGSLWELTEQPTPVPAGAAAAPWRMFTTTEAAPEPGAPRGELEGLFVPPAAAAVFEGPPIEDVRFLRDETANLVWAIEQTVPAVSGDPAPVKAGEMPPPRPINPGDAPAEKVLGYELQTFVPDNWHPYVAQVSEDGVLLRRARMADAVDGAAKGRLLAEDAQEVLIAAEVPRQGVRIQRIPRAARRADGTWSVWIGRLVTPAFGEGESGLQFDRTRRPTG